ncbi:MAG TPA: recombinase family protein [Candidatus Saccharimonadales bacterium]|nr:recombinase family protein [Candidatus Saccharimonadales bacterium]
MTKKVFAIANCRVSSIEQLLNNSLPRQESSVYAAAKELGVEIIKVWSGSVSSKKGSNVDRKDLEEMLNLCKKDKRIKFVIIDELDRFMRSILEIGYFLVLFKQQGVEVVFASQPNLKTDTAANTLLLMLEAYKAEGSNEERIHKSISGQTTALKDGRYPFHPKAGYMRGTNKGVPDVHPVRGIALREVFVRMAEHVVTPTEGLIELNKSDYTLERSPLKMDKFRKIATDPFYAGIVEINKQVKVRNENGEHEPLITFEQHEELLRIFDAKKKTQTGPRKNGNPKFPLNRITLHDTCLELKNKGKFVGYDHGNGKNPNLIYEKYRCRSCGFYLTRAELHPKVAQLFKDNPINEDGAKDFIEALDVVWKKKEAQARQDSVRIGQKIKALSDDIDNRAIAAIDPSNIKIKPEILANIEKMKTQVEELKEELHSLEQKMDTDKDKFLKFAFNFASNMGDNFMTITEENREKCKQIIFPAGFYMDADKNVYTPKISPLITLATTKKDTEVSKNVQMVRVTRL